MSASNSSDKSGKLRDLSEFEKSAKPGDLIEIDRTGYKHWAIGVGGGEVVHLTTTAADTSSNSGRSSLSMTSNNSATVMREKLSDVVGSSTFRVNNILDDKHTPRDSANIVKEASGMVGQKKPYSVISQNCEHFATEVRYGKPESKQVAHAVEMGATAVGIAAVAGAAVAVLGAITGGSNNRKTSH